MSVPRSLQGLRRFAFGITSLNIFGYAYLGFEPSILHPIVGVAAACGTELLLEAVEVLLLDRQEEEMPEVEEVHQ